MKLALALLMLLAALGASASDALILISPDAAGPVDKRGEWLLWPARDGAEGENRLLSLLTRVDWATGGDELVFGFDGGVYRSAAFDMLKARGYFLARSEVVDRPSFAVSGGAGLASHDALLLALEGRTPQPRVLALHDPWPRNALIIARCSNWDQVDGVSHRAGGRTLVIEGPGAERRWRRYWLQGSGWPTGLPGYADWKVAGLIPASFAGDLLLHPTAFSWTPNDATEWGGADRWLSFLAYATPLTLAILGFLGALFAGCAVYLVSRDEKAPFAALAVKYIALIPASILAAGRLTWVAGPELFALWLILCLAGLILAARGLEGLVTRLVPAANPMLAVCITGFAATATSQPIWSLFSNVLGVHPLPVSVEAVGALVAYLTGVCAFSWGSGAIWVAATISAFCVSWGFLLDPWWVGGQWPFAFLPIVAFHAGSGLYRHWQLPLALILAGADGRWMHGIHWAPGDLYWRYGDQAGINAARYVEFLVSPAFVGVLSVSAVMAIGVERYFFHELRRTWLLDRRTSALFHASALIAAMAAVQPLLLPAAMTCFLGGFLVLLTDTARSL